MKIKLSRKKLMKVRGDKETYGERDMGTESGK